MAFFDLFKSSQQHELESKMRFRQGRHRIQRFLQRLSQTADKYWQLARQGYRLGDQEQFRQLAGGYFRARETINRWERYLVKLNALEMRRGEVEATSEFLKSMNGLTSSILNGASPQDIQQMQLDLERALARSESQEEMLSMVMEETGARITDCESFDDRVLEELASSMGLSSTTSPNGQTDATFEATFAKAMRDLEKTPSSAP